MRIYEDMPKKTNGGIMSVVRETWTVRLRLSVYRGEVAADEVKAVVVPAKRQRAQSIRAVKALGWFVH